MEASDCAICSRESVGSVADAETGSGVPLGERAAFSVATIESGRLRGRSEAWEFGRRCHERGEFREGNAFEGDDFMGDIRFEPDSANSRSSSNGTWFSFVGELDSLSIALSIAESRRASKSPFASNFGVEAADRALPDATDARDMVGVFAGEDFVGDMDLARSELLNGQLDTIQKQCEL